MGSVLVVFLTERTRFTGGWVPWLSPVQVAVLREASIGIALILVLYVRSQGTLPERTRVMSLEVR